MGITVGSAANVTGTSGSNPAIASLSVTGSCVIKVSATLNVASISSISDSLGLTWTKRATSDAGALSNHIETWYATYTGGATSTVVTLNLNAYASYCTAVATPIYGVDSAIFDIGSADAGTSDPRSVTTNTANALVTGDFRQISNSSPGAGGGFTVDYNSGGYTLVEHMIQVSPGTVSVTDGASGDSNGGIGDAFKEAGGGGSPVTRSFGFFIGA